MELIVTPIEKLTGKQQLTVFSVGNLFDSIAHDFKAPHTTFTSAAQEKISFDMDPDPATGGSAKKTGVLSIIVNFFKRLFGREESKPVVAISSPSTQIKEIKEVVPAPASGSIAEVAVPSVRDVIEKVIPPSAPIEGTLTKISGAEPPSSSEDPLGVGRLIPNENVDRVEVYGRGRGMGEIKEVTVPPVKNDALASGYTIEEITGYTIEEIKGAPVEIDVIEKVIPPSVSGYNALKKIDGAKAPPPSQNPFEVDSPIPNEDVNEVKVYGRGLGKGVIEEIKGTRTKYVIEEVIPPSASGYNALKK